MGADETGSVEANVTANPGKGTLRYGLKVGDQVHKQFELRQVTSGDYFAAEADASVSKDVTFRAALLARQLVRIGTFEGPFSLAVLAKVPPPDLNTMLDAREALELSGEGWQLG